MAEVDQARFLINVGKGAIANQPKSPIMSRIGAYMLACEQMLAGDESKFSQVMTFIEDPNMKADFTAYFDELAGNDAALAVLDITSYACAFACRLTAKIKGMAPLPDTVHEARPEVYKYYQDRANFLGI